jgi:hypothetical protein
VRYLIKRRPGKWGGGGVGLRDPGAALLFFRLFGHAVPGQWQLGYVAAGLALPSPSLSICVLDTVALRVDIRINPWADLRARSR